MMKIPIITQNFSSPDVFNDTPLMLLPQAPPPPLPDRDQEGFSQLLLRDLHRHRQSYIRSFTAFETLKKRQDFVLRQENLRSLQNFEQRIQTKQDQFVDQSLHSYEQCFVKVINGNLNTHGNLHEQQRRVKSAAPSFDKFHLHQLSHIPATPLDPTPITPLLRYQKSHRPPKYRSQTNLYRSAQSFHDAFQSSSFSNHNQPFLTFTESYLQKYGDRSTNKFSLATDNDEIDEIKEKQEEDNDEQQLRSSSIEPNQKSKTSDLQRLRATITSRNTNTPSSTPQMGYHDATRDGLITVKDNDDHHHTKTSHIQEKRRSSQQSTSQLSNTDSKTSTKRPKTAKKKQITVTITPDKQDDNDLLKSAIFVQNYESNTNGSSKTEHLQLPVNIPRKTPSILRRSSIKSNEDTSILKQTLDNIDTQITTITTPTTTTTNEEIEPFKIDVDNQEQIIESIPNTIIEIEQEQNLPSINQQVQLEVPENRKRIKKNAFDPSESMNDLVAFELGFMGRNRSAMKQNRNRFGKENNQNEDGLESIPENQATLDLLEKIRQSTTGLSIGQPPVSQQGCRFELPYDLKLLETLTPLEYLSKYCRLSSRRNYQFKRIFDKYRNNQYRFESIHLYTSITDIHTEHFTRTQYDYLCQLINIENEQHQFTFDTFAGILALCERILYESSTFRNGLDDSDLAKDTIEKCDFDSLDRKFDGLRINETMRRLLNTI